MSDGSLRGPFTTRPHVVNVDVSDFPGALPGEVVSATLWGVFDHDGTVVDAFNTPREAVAAMDDLTRWACIERNGT